VDVQTVITDNETASNVSPPPTGCVEAPSQIDAAHWIAS